MDIKARSIRFGKSNFSPHEGDCFIIDEYGIQDEEIYHRSIVITKQLYEAFETNPHDDMLLDAFLERNDIHSKWQRYEVNFPNSVNSAVEMENLIRNPLIIDVFNEAIKEDEELVCWVSVFPVL